MARKFDQLTEAAVAALADRGLYHDGLGLYLQVAEGGSKSWVFRYMRNGKPRTKGLGTLRDLPLKRARKMRDKYRSMLAEGIDPLAEQDARRLEKARSRTFDQCVADYFKLNSAAWSDVHTREWQRSIERDASPLIGSMNVSAIDTPEVMKVLEPIWIEKTQSASRLRGRIETILGWAKVHGLRTGDNPARWKDHLENLLPKPGRIAKKEHHEAMPYTEVGPFLKRLRQEIGIGPIALELCILTAARIGEVTGAAWEEIDLERKTWTIPAARMKADKEHVVPLSPTAVEALERLPTRSGFLFTYRDNKPIRSNAPLNLIRSMGIEDATVHGFRSAFRDWAAEQTSYPRDVVEQCLAHAVGNAVELAYRRSDYLEKRRRVMDDWAAFLALEGVADVIPMRAAQ